MHAGMHEAVKLPICEVSVALQARSVRCCSHDWADSWKHCRQLSSMSESIAQRVDVAVDLQHRANKVLTHVLGAQYTLCEHSQSCVYINMGLWREMNPSKMTAFISEVKLA